MTVTKQCRCHLVIPSNDGQKRVSVSSIGFDDGLITFIKTVDGKSYDGYALGEPIYLEFDE